MCLPHVLLWLISGPKKDSLFFWRVNWKIERKDDFLSFLECFAHFFLCILEQTFHKWRFAHLLDYNYVHGIILQGKALHTKNLFQFQA